MAERNGIKGKALTIYPMAEEMGDGTWSAFASVTWEQGGATKDRRVDFEGAFKSELEAVDHSQEAARPYMQMAAVPAEWLKD